MTEYRRTRWAPWQVCRGLSSCESGRRVPDSINYKCLVYARKTSEKLGMNSWTISAELLKDLDNGGREEKKVGRGRRWWSYGERLRMVDWKDAGTANHSAYTPGLQG